MSLNRNHKHRLIRFMGDGSGEGVRWTIVDDSADKPEDAATDEPKCSSLIVAR